MEAENPPPVVIPTAAERAAAEAPRRKLSPMVTIGIAFALLASGVTYLLVGTGGQRRTTTGTGKRIATTGVAGRAAAQRCRAECEQRRSVGRAGRP